MSNDMFKDLKWEPHPSKLGGKRAIHVFANGWAASVLRGGPFYTRGGTYELAVMDGDGVSYETPITDNVLAYQSKKKINAALAAIAALPNAEKPFVKEASDGR